MPQYKSHPISNKKPNAKPKKSKWKVIKIFLKIGLVLFFLSILLIFGTFLYFIQDLPSPEKIKDRQVVESTKIYDKAGEHLLYEIHGEEKRTIVPLSEMSEYIKQATLAAEDDEFYKHPGIDFKSIIRAVFADLRGLSYSQGASTITQQFVKNSILSREKTITRKFKELILSLELERRFSKDQIFEMYLNQIPYGSNAYGIEAASRTFFSKPAKDLDLAESAALASLPKAPTRLSPFGSQLDELEARRDFVLRRMKDLGHIDEEKMKEAQERILEYTEKKENIIAPHFVMYVKEQIAEKFGEDFIEQEGLKVFTTLDIEKQKIAEETVKAGVEKNQAYSAYNASLVALDAKSGEILAMVGSKDYFGEVYPKDCTPGKNCQFEPNVNVALRERQPGSSFKPFAYAKAFQKGFTPDTLFFDLKTNFGPPGPNQENYIPQNYDLKQRGPVTMKFALANSLNIPAVKTLYLAGVEDTIDLAQNMGISTLQDRSRFNLALVLGGGEVKLLDMVSAYAVFAQEGIAQKSHAILRIEDKTGKVIEEFQEPDREVLDKQIARQINQILSDNNLRSPVFGVKNYLTLGEREAGVKTGTTQQFRDAWTIGYTPSIVTGVWVGNNDNSIMHLADGSKVAAPIWNTFMKKILTDAPKESFAKPETETYNKMILHGKFNEKKVRLCKIDNKLATDKVPLEETFEKEFKEIHSILYFINKNDPRGLAPTDPKNDPQYERWEQEVQKWVKTKGIALENIPTDTCEQYYLDDKRPSVEFLEIEENHEFQDGEIDLYIKINSERNIKLAEFYLNDYYIGRGLKDEEEGIWKFKTRSFQPSGSYILKARVFDDIGAVGQKEIKIYLRNNNILALEKPTNEDVLGLDKFPYELEAIGAHAQGIEKVNFYYKNPNQDGEYLIGSSVVSEQGTNRYKLIWKTQPGPLAENEDKSKRVLKIFAHLYSKNGEVIQSQSRQVELRYVEEEVK